MPVQNIRNTLYQLALKKYKDFRTGLSFPGIESQEYLPATISQICAGVKENKSVLP
jgi:hypothetical protein